jgi:hypothetical protein
VIIGLSISAFTTLHVIISLVAIAAGIPVLAGMFRSEGRDGWTALFLATTVATSVTGFMFPLVRVGPPHIIGGISMVVLAAAVIALYVGRLAGAWRWIYVVGAVVALYLNVFVGIVQAFQKLGFLNRLAPTQTEPAFLAAQGIALVAFLVLGGLAVRRFRPAARR